MVLNLDMMNIDQSRKFSYPSSQAPGFFGMTTFKILSARYFELCNTTPIIIITLYKVEDPIPPTML